MWPLIFCQHTIHQVNLAESRYPPWADILTMQTTKNQNMAGTKVQTSKVWKCPIFPDLARFSGETGSKWDWLYYFNCYDCIPEVLPFHNKEVENIRATIVYSLIEWGDNWLQKMEPTWGVRLIKEFFYWMSLFMPTRADQEKSHRWWMSHK